MKPRELTVYVISCDRNPNRENCLAAIRNQTFTNFDLVETRNVAPMSAAFQQMLSDCKTPYFVQVDEDMILYPEAIATLLQDMQSSGPMVAFIVYMLRDPHVDMDIQGVKIYRHETMRKYPYDQKVISCERNQLDRLRDDGYQILDRRQTIGLHSPEWVPELIFERYLDLMEKWKVYGYTWLESLPRKLHQKYVEAPNENNLYAFLGAMASATTPARLRHREKDYRIKTREFILARSWLSQPTQATLYLTTRCNLKCSWCLRQGDMAHVSPAPDLDPSIVDELKRRFPSLHAVCLCGFGETLLHPNVAGILRHAKQHQLYTNLITNGVLLEDALPGLLAERPSVISVSLNAANKEEHERQTGVSGAWDQIMRGFEALQDYRLRWKDLHSSDTGIPIVLSRVCTTGNLGGIPEFLELAQQLGVSKIDLHNVLPHDVGTPEKLNAFLGEVLTIDYAEEINKLKRLRGSDMVRTWPILIDPAHPVRHCQFIYNAIAVDGNRNISICNSVFPPRPENGTILDPKCWHNEHCEAVRLSFADTEIHPACRFCFRNWQ